MLGFILILKADPFKSATLLSVILFRRTRSTRQNYTLVQERWRPKCYPKIAKLIFCPSPDMEAQTLNPSDAESTRLLLEKVQSLDAENTDDDIHLSPEHINTPPAWYLASGLSEWCVHLSIHFLVGFLSFQLIVPQSLLLYGCYKRIFQDRF